MKKIRLLPFLLLLFLLISCEGDGIFYSIREEVLIENAGFPDEAVIRSLFTVEDINNVNSIALGRSLWLRTDNSNWNLLTFPSSLPKEQTAITSAVEFHDRIYASFYTNGTTSIWNYDTVNNTWTGVTSWSLPESSDLYYLFSVSEVDSLYISQEPFYDEETVDFNTLIYYSEQADLSDISVIDLSAFTPTMTISLRDIAWDGTNHWLALGDTAMATGSILTTGASQNVLTMTAAPATPYYSINIINHSEPIVLAGTSSSLLYSLNSTLSNTNADNWNSFIVTEGDALAFIELPSEDNIDYPFLIGKNGNGGYETLNYNTTNDTITVLGNIATNYSSSELKKTYIWGFVLRPLTGSDYKLYAATTNGLWSFLSTESKWSQE